MNSLVFWVHHDYDFYLQFNFFFLVILSDEIGWILVGLGCAGWGGQLVG